MRAIQLRTGALPCQGLPSNPVGSRNCRSHILQSCPLVHDARVQRHDAVVSKIAAAVRRTGTSVDVEVRVRHPDGQLYKPDLVIHQPGRKEVVICDVQVSWEGPRSLADTWTRKKLVYDHAHFREAARERDPLWPHYRGSAGDLAPGQRAHLGATPLAPLLTEDHHQWHPQMGNDFTLHVHVRSVA